MGVGTRASSSCARARSWPADEGRARDTAPRSRARSEIRAGWFGRSCVSAHESRQRQRRFVRREARRSGQSRLLRDQGHDRSNQASCSAPFTRQARRFSRAVELLLAVKVANTRDAKLGDASAARRATCTSFSAASRRRMAASTLLECLLLRLECACHARIARSVSTDFHSFSRVDGELSFGTLAAARAIDIRGGIIVSPQTRGR
mgnify:CR=1 FL=1